METKKVIDLPSVALWFNGLEFIVTAKVALDSLRTNKSFGPIVYPNTNPIGDAPSAIYFNFLHGIELCLKSYLVHEVGMLEKELRKFSHDLDRLLKEALKHRLECACTELTATDLQTIRFLSEHYSSKKFEYIWMRGPLEILDIDLVVQAANHLVSGLKDLIRTPLDALSDSEKKEVLSDSRRRERSTSPLLVKRSGRDWRLLDQEPQGDDDRPRNRPVAVLPPTH